MTRQELLNKRLKMYIDAEEVIISGGQSYMIGDRMLTRANLQEIRKMIEYLLEQGALLEGMSEKRIKSVARVIYDDC